MIHTIAKSEFAQTRREPLLDYDAYNDEIEDISRRVPNAQKKLNDPEWLAGKDEAALVRLTEARCDHALDLLTINYSAGANISELADFFPCIVDYFDEHALYTQAFNGTDEGARINTPVIHLQDVEFQIANRLLCFSVVLGHAKLIPRIMLLGLGSGGNHDCFECRRPIVPGPAILPTRPRRTSQERDGSKCDSRVSYGKRFSGAA